MEISPKESSIIYMAWYYFRHRPERLAEATNMLSGNGKKALKAFFKDKQKELDKRKQPAKVTV